MATRIRLRRDTATRWQNINPVLSLGEPGVETDTGKMKIGNGSSTWNSLSYFAGGSGGAESDRLVNGTKELVLGSDGVITLPNDETIVSQLSQVYIHKDDGDSSGEVVVQAGGVALQAVSIADGDNRSGRIEAGLGAVQVATSGVHGNSVAWAFDNKGTLSTPLLLPVTFTAVLDTEHMYPGPGIGFTDTPWQFEVQFQVEPLDDSVVTYLNNPFPILTNPGYVSGHTFRFTEADHGIPDFDFDITLNNVTLPGGAGWTANPSVTPPPAYPSTVKSSGAIKLTANESDYVFGTNGTLTLPNNPTITTNFGNINILAENYLRLNAGNFSQLEIGTQQTNGLVAIGGKGTHLVVAGTTVYSNQDTTFGLTLDDDHYVSGPGLFNGNGQVTLALTLNRTGTVYNWSIATATLNGSNQGYQVGDTFAFNSTVHGVFDHIVTVTIDSLTETDPGVWELVASVTSPAVTLAEASKIKFIDTVGVLVGTKTWLLGTDGKLYLPSGGDIVNSAGNSVLGSGSVVERTVVFPAGADGDTRGTIALTPGGETYICTADWEDADLQGDYEGETSENYDVSQSGGLYNSVSLLVADQPVLYNILQNGNWNTGELLVDAGVAFGGPQDLYNWNGDGTTMYLVWTHRTGVDPTTIAQGTAVTITFNGTMPQPPIWQRLIAVAGGTGGEDSDGTINWTSEGDLTIETVRPDGYTGDCDLNLYAADDVFIEAYGDEVSIRANSDVSIESDTGSWKFGADGSLQLSEENNTGYQASYSLTAATLRLSNDLAGGENNPAQVVITGPRPTSTTADAQRLIIQGQKGWGGEGQSKGEGGDVYIWAGTGGDGGSIDSQGDGGDVKLRGGQGGTYGGYVRIESGNATANSGTGGFVDVNAGNGDGPAGNGGDVNIRAGSGGANNGEVNIYTVGTNNHWVFKNDGSLQLPTGGDIVDSTGTTVLGGGGSAAELIGDDDVAQTGTITTIYTDANGAQSTNGPATSIVVTDSFDVGDIIKFRTGEEKVISSVDVDTPAVGQYTLNWSGAVEDTYRDPKFPITIQTSDYVAAVKKTARIKPDESQADMNGQYVDIYTGAPADENGHIHMKGHGNNIELFLGTDANFVSTKEAGSTPGHITMRSESEIKIIETSLRTTRNGSTFVSNMGDNVNYDFYRNGTADIAHNCVAVDEDGNYYVGGEHTNEADALVSKFSKDGALIWSKKVNGNAWNARAIAVNSDTGTIGVAFQTNQGRSNTYIKFVEFDRDGFEESTWTDYYDPDGYIDVYDVKYHSSLGWVIAGQSYGDELVSASLSPQTGSGVAKLVLTASATDLYNDLMDPSNPNWRISGSNISGKLTLGNAIGLFKGLTPTNVTVANPAAAGAVINVRINYAGGTYYQIAGVTTPGTNYTVGDTIKVLGSQLGGTDVTHDVVFTIDAVDGSGGIVSSNGAAGTPDLTNITLDLTENGFTTEDFSTGSYVVHYQVEGRPLVITSTWKRFLETQTTGNYYGHVRGLDIDAGGNMYIGGYVAGTFNTGAGSEFLWKLDSSGATQWITGSTGYVGDINSVAVAESSVFIFAVSAGGSGVKLTKYYPDGSAGKSIVPSGPYSGTPTIDTAVDEHGVEYLYVTWASYSNIGAPSDGMLVQKFTLDLEHVWSRELYLENAQSLNTDYDTDARNTVLTNKQAVVVGFSKALGNQYDNGFIASLSITDDFVPTEPLGVNGVITGYTDWPWINDPVSIENLALDLSPETSTAQTATGATGVDMIFFKWQNRILPANGSVKGLVDIENINFIQGGDLDHNPIDIPQSTQNLQIDDPINWNITLNLSDRGKFIKNRATPSDGTIQDLTVYIPSNTDVPFPIGSVISLINLDTSDTYKIQVEPVGYGSSEIRLWCAGFTNASVYSFLGLQTATLMKIADNDWLLTANNATNED